MAEPIAPGKTCSRHTSMAFIRSVATAAILLSTGCVSFPVFDARLSSAEKRQDKNVRILGTIAVRDSSQAQDAVKDLLATGLFKDVYPLSPEKKPDFIMDVRHAGGAVKCGAPFLTSALTLGLVSAKSSYRHLYEFTLSSPSTERSLMFNKTYTGSMYMPSILLLPFTFHKRWPDRVDLLRHDLVALKPEIESLSIPVGEYEIRGEVLRPGKYSCCKDITLLTALARAGRYTEAADRNHVRLTRNGETLVVDLGPLREGGVQQPIIHLGDIIEIPSRLAVPGKDPVIITPPKEVNTNGFVRHVVIRNQDLQEIVVLYGVDAETIKRFNGLKGDALREGQELRIPEPK